MLKLKTEEGYNFNFNFNFNFHRNVKYYIPTFKDISSSGFYIQIQLKNQRKLISCQLQGGGLEEELD